MKNIFKSKGKGTIPESFHQSNVPLTVHSINVFVDAQGHRVNQVDKYVKGVKGLLVT